MSRFQSTPPHGRRPAHAGLQLRRRQFQSTPPHGRRLSLTAFFHLRPFPFQSTPPHGRRPASATWAMGVSQVSIHASAREATVNTLAEGLRKLVSIHASAREATRASLDCWPFSWMFQSTPPHGRRRVKTGMEPRMSCFNPRLRTGGDVYPNRKLTAPRSFNPRLRTGGDLTEGWTWLRNSRFQSTPPHGRRPQLPPAKMGEAVVSIHASAREATGALFQSGARDTPFQSTPPHGRRRQASGHFQPPCQFQSTPPHGRRHFTILFESFDQRVSIHASAREATLSILASRC